jgi:hypothetical protein
MITRKIDAALEAMASCRACLPDLRDLYRKDSPERVALDDLLKALRRTDDVLVDPGRRGPGD